MRTVKVIIPRWQYFTLALLGFLLVLVLWSLATYTGFVQDFFIPTPTAVVSSLVELLVNEGLIIGAEFLPRTCFDEEMLWHKDIKPSMVREKLNHLDCWWLGDKDEEWLLENLQKIINKQYSFFSSNSPNEVS